MTTSVLAILREGATGAFAVDRLFGVLLAVCVGVSAVLIALVVGFCVKYRAGSKADRSGMALQKPWVEVGWLSGLLVVFLAIAGWSNVDFFRAREAPADAYTVYVVGRQWMWKVEHPSGRREIDEVHVPVGEPVRIVLASDDVIHSFFVPDFRVKQDAVPGRSTSLWFTASEAGEHHLFCAQYCGAEHSGMIGKVIAMAPADFEKWLADRPAQEKTPGAAGSSGVGGAEGAPLSARLGGRAAFYRLGCAACHVEKGAVTAPRLDGIWGKMTRLNNGREVLVDEDYVRESVLDPNAKIVAGYAEPSAMPSFKGAVSEEDVVELVEFIKSIEHGWPAGEKAPGPAGTSAPAGGTRP